VERHFDNKVQSNPVMAPLFVSAICGYISKVEVNRNTVEEGVSVHRLLWVVIGAGTVSGFAVCEFIIPSK